MKTKKYKTASHKRTYGIEVACKATCRKLALHRYCIVAFLTVLMTYFGVNFLLGGMHSYV